MDGGIGSGEIAKRQNVLTAMKDRNLKQAMITQDKKGHDIQKKKCH